MMNEFENKFEETARDLLVELRSDVKHVRTTTDALKASDSKQWEKLDDLSVIVKGHEKSIGFLEWGFRFIAGGAATVLGGIIVYYVTH